jgi:hypothetical protein
VYGDDESAESAEHAEPDPEADLPNYEEELVDVPEPPEAPEPPSVPDPAEGLRDVDVPDYVRTYFWRTVLVVDYALAAVSLGPMVAYFRGELRLGLGITASGVFAFGYAYLLYRQFQRASAAHDEGDGEAADLETSSEASTDGESNTSPER